jgi:hypothetical protein
MIAGGCAEQTTENIGAGGAYAPGAFRVDPATMLLQANPVNELLGVRIPSHASVNLTDRFGVRSER